MNSFEICPQHICVEHWGVWPNMQHKTRERETIHFSKGRRWNIIFVFQSPTCFHLLCFVCGQRFMWEVLLKFLVEISGGIIYDNDIWLAWQNKIQNDTEGQRLNRYLDKSGISGWVSILIKASTGPRQSPATRLFYFALSQNSQTFVFRKIVTSDPLVSQSLKNFENLKLVDFRCLWTSSRSFLRDRGE